MKSYFNFYYRHFVAGVVIMVILLIISLIAEGVKWIVQFIKG